MLCDNFKCVNLVDDECDLYGGECIGDQCEDWGVCLDCQKVTDPGDCWKEQRGSGSGAADQARSPRNPTDSK